MLTLFEVSLDSFQIKPVEEGSTLILKLSGTGDMVAVEPLKKSLAQVRLQMKACAYASLKIDIQSLYLLNSSCIKTVVHFIYLNQEEGPFFPIEFIVDGKLSWQPRALAALKRLAPKMVTITEAAS